MSNKEYKITHNQVLESVVRELNLDYYIDTTQNRLGWTYVEVTLLTELNLIYKLFQEEMFDLQQVKDKYLLQSNNTVEMIIEFYLLDNNTKQNIYNEYLLQQL